MSKTQLNVRVSFTVHSVDNLPVKCGEQMYADDVEVEVRAVLQAAIDAWMAVRGCELLACEPLVS